MSFYETYEFFALDRTLTIVEMRGTREPARCAGFATRSGQTILTLSPPEGDAEDVFGNRSDDDDAGELDQVSWGVPLAVLRSGLLAGDLRGLYLAWLCSVQAGERSVTAREPPRPEGLSDLTGVLYTFAEFLGLNADLMSVALTDDARGSRTVGELLDAARAHAAARRRRATSRPRSRAGKTSRRSRS